MRGVGRGVVGLVLEPLVGASGGVAKIVEGFSNAAGGGGDGGAAAADARARSRRVFYGRHRVMRPFARLDAFARAALDIGVPAARHDAFVAAVADGDTCVVTTSARVIVMDMRHAWRVLQVRAHGDKHSRVWSWRYAFACVWSWRYAFACVVMTICIRVCGHDDMHSRVWSWRCAFPFAVIEMSECAPRIATCVRFRVLSCAHPNSDRRRRWSGTW